MTKPFSIVASVCLIVLTGAICVGGYGLYPHVTGALDAWAKAGSQATTTLQQGGQSVNSATDALAKTTAKLNTTLDAINAPCVGFHGSTTCGPLAQLSQTEKNVGILAAQSALQVKQSSALVDAASDAVSTMATAGGKTLDAATDLAKEATTTLKTVNDPKTGIQPILSQSSAAVGHFDALIQSGDVTDTLHNANIITAAWAGTSQDFHVWSHKLWNPDPCRTAACKWGRGFKVAGGYLGLAAQAGEASTFWRPIPVKVK